jgi:WD40 repeat protein
MLKDFIKYDKGKKGHLEEDEAMMMLESRDETTSFIELRNKVRDIDLHEKRNLSFLEWCCAVFDKSWIELHQRNDLIITPEILAEMEKMRKEMEEAEAFAEAANERSLRAQSMRFKTDANALKQLKELQETVNALAAEREAAALAGSEERAATAAAGTAGRAAAKEAGETERAAIEAAKAAAHASLSAMDVTMEQDADTFILKGHTGSVTHAAFHSDPKKPLIATCSYDSTVMLWSRETKQRIHTFEGHTDRVWSVAFSNPTTTANNFIVSAGADCTSRIWDIDAQVCVAVLTGFTASIWSASFIPHSTKCKDARLDEATIRTAFGGRIITTSKDADIVCWDSRAREGISIFRPTGDMMIDAECTACAYSSQSTSELVTSSKSTSGDSSGIVRIWSLRALARETQLKQEDEALKQERKDKARSFESRIEAGLQELKPSELLMDRWTVDHELCRPIDLDPSGNGHTGCVLSVDFSSDGNRLVTASTDLTAIVWERTSGSAAVDAPAWKMITRIRDTGEKMITRIRDTSETSERRELSEARFHPNNSNVVVKITCIILFVLNMIRVSDELIGTD